MCPVMGTGLAVCPLDSQCSPLCLARRRHSVDVCLSSHTVSDTLTALVLLSLPHTLSFSTVPSAPGSVETSSSALHCFLCLEWAERRPGQIRFTAWKLLVNGPILATETAGGRLLMEKGHSPAASTARLTKPTLKNE